MIVDAQLHEPTVQLDWSDAGDETRNELLTELQLAYMRAVGIDAAILFPVDLGWGRQAAVRMPDKFAVVPMIIPGGMHDGLDPAAPDIAERIADSFMSPGVVGLRAMVVVAPATTINGSPTASIASGIERFREGLFDATFQACEEQHIPLFISASGELAAAAEVAARHPDLKLIVDHLGILEPPSFIPDSPPLRALPELLALAEHPNLFVKVTGMPTLSREPYPFADLWPSIRRIVDEFGADRLLWGSDISRVHGRLGFNVEIAGGLDAPYEGRHVYAESVLAFRETDLLSEDEKRLLMGETASRILNWPAAKPAEAGSSIREVTTSPGDHLRMK